MKILLCTALIINISESYKFIVSENIMDKCLRIAIFYGQYHTIYMDNANDTNEMLKSCLIRNIYINQTLLLIKGVDYLPKNQITSTNPNVIIVTKLSDEFLNSTSISKIIKSHSSLLYVVSTDRTKYMCDNERFNKSIFTNIENFLNTLWQKHQILRVVLTFPYTCPDIYVIYDGKKQTDTKLFDRTIKIVKPKTFSQLNNAILNSGKGLTQGFPLKASIFNRFPTSILNCDKIKQYLKWNENITDGFCGMDGLILLDTINHFNFKVSFPKYENCSRFGYRNKTGFVTGSLGCILSKTIDVSFNSRFMVSYANDVFYFLHYTVQDSLCVLLARPPFIALWHYPHRAYTLEVFILLITFIIVLSIVSWYSDKVTNKLTRKASSKFHSHLFDFVTSMLFGFSIHMYQKRCILRGISLVCSIIILGIYQGYINYAFTTLVRYPRLKTLQELYASDNILHTSPSVRDLLKSFENSTDAIQEFFFKRTQLNNHTDLGVVLQNKNVVTLCRKMDGALEIMLNHTDNKQWPLIYILEDCFDSFYVSYIARAGFPFTKELNMFMEHLLQAGLPKTYYRWTQQTLNVPDTLPKYRSIPLTNRKIRMKDQRIAFSILFIGYVISICVFIREKWMVMKNKQQKF